jgi:hypothetical protein
LYLHRNAGAVATATRDYEQSKACCNKSQAKYVRRQPSTESVVMRSNVCSIYGSLVCAGIRLRSRHSTFGLHFDMPKSPLETPVAPSALEDNRFE